MKKSYLILLACIGLICGIAYAQKYVVVNQGAKKTGYLLSKVDSITHTSNQVTINMAGGATYDVQYVDSITFSSEDGIVELDDKVMDLDKAFVTEGHGFYGLYEGCVCSSTSKYNAITYFPSDDVDPICLISTVEGNIPTQIVAPKGILYFSYPNDSILELVFDNGESVTMIDNIEYSMEALENNKFGDDVFKSSLYNVSSLMMQCSSMNELIVNYKDVFAAVCELPYVEDEELVNSLPVAESGHFQFAEQMCEWYNENVEIPVCKTLFLWTGDASYKVGGSSCTLSATIWCPSYTYNEYGTYGIVCDTDPAKLTLEEAEYQDSGYQSYEDLSFSVDFRGLKPNTTYYYRAYYKFNTEDHGNINPRYGADEDQVIYDAIYKSFRTGENMLTVDVVMCIDVTGSMSSIINTVKYNAIGFYDAFKACCDSHGIQLTGLNTQVVAFRDKYFDGSSWLQTSDTYWLPEQKSEFSSFVNGLYATGGGDTPESGLEALQTAFNKTDWSVDDGYHRQVIILWTDAPYLINNDIGHFSDVELSELKAQWDAMPSGRRLVLFAPYGTVYDSYYGHGYNSGDWGNLDSWKNVIHETDFYNGFNNFEYILESIIGELTSKALKTTNRTTIPYTKEFRPNE